MNRSHLPVTLPGLALAVISASAQSLYGNGPLNRALNAWTINFLSL